MTKTEYLVLDFARIMRGDWRAPLSAQAHKLVESSRDGVKMARRMWVWPAGKDRYSAEMQAVYLSGGTMDASL